MCNLANPGRKNRIVVCDGCNGLFHQLCHKPAIDDRVVADTSADWFCSNCQAIRDMDSSVGALQGLVGGQCYLKEDKEDYLDSLSHGALRSILGMLAERHPQLEIFPVDMQVRLERFRVARQSFRGSVSGSSRAASEVYDQRRQDKSRSQEASDGQQANRTASLTPLLDPGNAEIHLGNLVPLPPTPRAGHEQSELSKAYRKTKRVKVVLLPDESVSEYLPPYEEMISEALAYIADPHGSTPTMIWRYLAE